MRRLSVLAFVVAGTLALQAVVGGYADAAAPAWTTYRHDAARSGIDPDGTSPVTPSQAWQTPALDGALYGQPLVYGPYVYVATENDTVYELDAATGGVVWSTHLATPESSSMAPCSNISPSIGITSTPVIDPSTNRIYAVGATSDGVNASSVRHELFALDLSSGQPVAGFPITVDPPFPSGGAAVNQLQRAGLALDSGRILIGYGGNSNDCATYWGWLVSAPTHGTTALDSFQVDASYTGGGIWASGNAPAIDAAGNVFIATGNGFGDTTSDPNYGESVVKLDSSASPLDWWTELDWQSNDALDGDLGSSMPALLPGGYLFQSGKDGDGYVLNGASLGNVSAAPSEATYFCPNGSWGGAVYDPANSTIYAACYEGVQALTLGSGSPPSVSANAVFSAPPGATGPPIIAGGLVWAANGFGASSGGTLYGLDPTTGATESQFSIPESGSYVNNFESPSAGGGRLFIASGDQVTAFTIAQPPAASPTTTTLASSSNPAPAGTEVTLTAAIAPVPYSGTVTFTDGGAPLSGCSGIAVSAATAGKAECQAAFAGTRTHNLAASYSGDAFYTTSNSAVLAESVTSAAGVASVSRLRASPHRVLIAGREVGRRCVKPTEQNQRHKYCQRPLRLRVTYTLDEAATVTFTLKRQAPGRKVKGRCVRQTNKNRKRSRCPRWVGLHGSIARVGQAGANAFTFTGEIGGHKLAPGVYLITATPSAGSDRTSREVEFQIVG